MTQLQKAILQTLAYADVFGYPLTPQEIRRWLIKLKTQNSKLKITIQNSKFIQEKKGFYFLGGKEKLVGLRKKRERWSQEKWLLAKKVARWLRLIPWVKMVAVTGNLAMNNSNQDDDIDFLIVPVKDRLWLTRFLTVFLVELVANRRRPGDREIKDKICLNMFLDENHLKIPLQEQNLFTAHEVCQIKLLWERSNTYQKFLKANLWSQKFLPNWKP